MLDKTFFLVFSVILSGTMSNLFLNYMDSKYNIGNFTRYFVTYLFVMVPMSLHLYAKNTSKCKKKNFISNGIEALKSATVTVGIVDILSFIIRFIPIIGTIHSLIEYIPLFGIPSVWLTSYFIYTNIMNLIKIFKKKNNCSNTSSVKVLVFMTVSLVKSLLYNIIPF